MYLIDKNLPIQLFALLGEFGIAAETAEFRKWSALTDGELVRSAAQAGFTCILTRDRLFARSAARQLKEFPTLSIVVVELPQLRREPFLDAFRKAWSRNPIQPLAGRATNWPPDNV